MTRGDPVQLRPCPARLAWRALRGLQAGHSRVVGLTAERFGVLSSDGQAKVLGATIAAWYGFGATDHYRAGRPCA
jgi:hypothetical protein